MLLYDISHVDSPLLVERNYIQEVNIQYYAGVADCRWIEVLQLGQYQEKMLLLWLPLHLCE